MKISDIQIKDKTPFRAYFNRTPIWWKYHERTQAIFDYANERYYQLPTNKLAYDDYIRGVVKEGLFDKLDLHYIFSGDGDINFKLLNIINPGTYNGTAFGGLEWTNEGVKGNGVNGYIDTNFITAYAEKYKVNDACRCGVVYENPSNSVGLSTIDGITAGDNNVLNAANHRFQSINRSIGDMPDVDNSGVALKAITVFNDACFIVNKNTIIYDNPSYNPTTTYYQTQLILTRRLQVYATITLSMYFAGSSLTYDETQLERQFLNEYLIDLGLEPIA